MVLSMTSLEYRRERYFQKIIASACGEVANAPEGARHTTLVKHAYIFAEYQAGGEPIELEFLREPAKDAGLGDREINGVFNGIRKAIRPKRAKPFAHIPTASARSPLPAFCATQTSKLSKLRLPPQNQVLRVWLASQPVMDSELAVDFLKSRGLCPSKVELFDLARVLPLEPFRLPKWCRSWRQLAPLILPIFDQTGDMVSLHGRALQSIRPKTRWPTGFRIAGTAMADGFGIRLLQGEPVTDTVVIAEGLPDFLTFATATSEVDDCAPAVLGVANGTWSREIADRIPDEATVVIATHHDAAGDSYAKMIVNTIGARCNLRRWHGASDAS
jgi:hypothetical protein